MKRIISRALALALLLLAIIIASNHYRNAAAAPTEISSPNSPSWNVTPPGTKISNNVGVGANEPAIAASPNGTLMIVYNNWMTSSNDRDPYYSISTNGGLNWSTPAPIYSSAGVNSIQVDVAFYNDSTAHAVWAELVDVTPPLKTTALFYARYNGSTWTGPTTLASITSPFPLIGHPRIVATNSYIDVVWEEGNPTSQDALGGNAAILHKRSANGGQGWSNNIQISPLTTAPAVTADVEIDASGRPHAVWRQSLPAGDSEIRYTEGNISGGNSVSWLASINVSQVVTNTNQPELLIGSDGRIHTSFTQSIISGVNSFDQWVYYTFCDQSCMTPGNWEIPFNTLVDPVEVNDNSPFDVVSDIVFGSNSCAYIFFHGLRDDTFGRELVWNVNSCDGWNHPEGWDPVTHDDTRAIFPRSVVSQQTIHLTFQLVSDADVNSIYYMNGAFGTFGPTGAFLPAILKN